MVKKTGKLQRAFIMVCSKCGFLMSERDPVRTDGFDIYSCGWRCKGCSSYWYSSDGWEEVGNLLIPHRDREMGLRT